MPFSTWLWGLWLLGLVAIYPVPHTIALRNVWLLLGTLLLLWCAVRRPVRPLGVRREMGWVLIILGVLTGWLLLQSVFLSPFASQALRHLRGEWLMVLWAALAGFLAATRTAGALRAAVLALAGHIIVLLGWQLSMALMAGHWPIGQTPFAARDYHSLLNSMLLALLMADRLVAGLQRNEGLLKWPRHLVWGLVALSLTADVLLTTRNGTLVTVLLLGVAGTGLLWPVARRRPRLALAGAASVAGAIFLIAAAAWTFDARWQRVGESLATGWHSDSLAWLDEKEHQTPLLSDGRVAEGSAYLRAAWLRQAVDGVAQNPLGLGYGHKAFGWYIQLKYGRSGMESSHSGLMDFTLANGIPGLGLWLWLNAALVFLGWHAYRRHGLGAGLAVMLLTVAYLARCTVDGHLSGWRLELWALLIGLSLPAVLPRARRS